MSVGDLKKLSLLRELSEEERDAVADELELQTLAEGDVLFHEGEEADGLVFVAAGSLRLGSRRTPESGIAGPGTALGALSLVALGARESSAVAASACRVLWLRRSAFRRLVEDAPRAACRLLEAATSEFAASVRRSLDGLAHPVDPSRDGS